MLDSGAQLMTLFDIIIIHFVQFQAFKPYLSTRALKMGISFEAERILELINDLASVKDL
jgi:hypothetical protein